jgi:tetratricopeptide (TPR) repeat protein
MSHLRTGCVALLLAGFGLVLHATAKDDPSKPASDPASDIIDGLLKQLDEPATTKPPAKADDPPRQPTRSAAKRKAAPADDLPHPVPDVSAESVIDQVTSRADELAAKKARNAALLLEQAKAANQSGNLAEAIRLASSAKRMNPANKQIAEFLSSLNKETGKSTFPNQAKAVGRLAAGVARGQELIEQGRYARGIDLLSHAVQAAALFPPEAGVTTYKKMAEREINLYHQRVDRGEIQADDSLDSAAEDPILVATGSAAPINARRILRTLEEVTPLWYAQIKNRLAFNMSVDYDRRPLADIIEEIAKATSVKLMIDETLLRSRTHINTLVDFRIADVPAERILDIACAQAGIEYVIMERGVIITTASRAVRYLRDLPESVRNNWLAARTLFPETTPELLAAPPLPNGLPGQSALADDELDADVPSYLRTGKALLADIRSLLASK